MEALMMEGNVSSWNDDRLDELNGRVDKGFARVDGQFAEIRGELRQMNDRFDRRFDCLDEQLSRLMHALMVAGLSFGIATFASLGGLLITQI
jgi:hypothetical protein